MVVLSLSEKEKREKGRGKREGYYRVVGGEFTRKDVHWRYRRGHRESRNVPKDLTLQTRFPLIRVSSFYKTPSPNLLPITSSRLRNPSGGVPVQLFYTHTVLLKSSVTFRRQYGLLSHWVPTPEVVEVNVSVRDIFVPLPYHLVRRTP